MITVKQDKATKLPGGTSLYVTFPYNQALVDLIHQDTGNFDKKTLTWELPITTLSSFVNCARKFDEVQIELLPEKRTRKKSKSDVDFGKFKTNPFDYQKEGIQFCLDNEKCLLLDGMGLGKTLQSIYTAEERKRKGEIDHCLIICGVNTLKFNWLNEIKRHSKFDGIILGQKIDKKGKIKIGSVQDRINQLKSPIKEFFVITNIETLRNDDVAKLIEKNKVNKFDMIILDELHCCKTPSSQQGKNLLKLKSAKYKLGMTGTVLMNSPMDAYVPLKWIGAETSTYTNFKYYYCKFGGIMGQDFLGYKHLDILKDQLSQWSLRRTKDVLDLPPKTVIDELVEMNPSQERFYSNIVDGVVDEADKVKINTVSLLAMVTRLRQATACPSILTSEDIKSSKIERAKELVEEAVGNGSKVVIFSTFKETCNVLQKELKEFNPLVCTGDTKDTQKAEYIKAFQEDKEHKVMIATWQCMGTGVTLTAADTEIFIDIPWTQAVFEQAQDRCYRIGTTKNVTIYNLICPNTFDERVREIVTDKKLISDYVVDDKVHEGPLADKLKQMIADLKVGVF